MDTTYAVRVYFGDAWIYLTTVKDFETTEIQLFDSYQTAKAAADSWGNNAEVEIFPVRGKDVF